MANDTVIVACETLKQELEATMAAMGCTLPVAWVESDLHAWPDKLRVHLQKTIDELPPEYTTVLLVFGFCGGGMVGVRAGTRTLVLPRVADCIPLFLGSQQRRQEAGSDVYFFTEGYLSGEQNIVREYDYYRAKYGQKRADRIVRAMMTHYKRFAVVDTGAFEIPPVVARIRPQADLLGIPVQVVPGNLILLKDLLAGNTDNDRFLRVPPGGAVRFEDSLGLGDSQAAPAREP